MSAIRSGTRPRKSSRSRHRSASGAGQCRSSRPTTGWFWPSRAARGGAIDRDRGGAGHRRTRWSDQQKRAYVIADNRLTDASDCDDEMLRLELNDLLELALSYR